MGCGMVQRDGIRVCETGYGLRACHSKSPVDGDGRRCGCRHDKANSGSMQSRGANSHKGGRADCPPDPKPTVRSAPRRFDCVTSIPWSYMDIHFYLVRRMRNLVHRRVHDPSAACDLVPCMHFFDAARVRTDILSILSSQILDAITRDRLYGQDCIHDQGDGSTKSDARVIRAVKVLRILRVARILKLARSVR